VVKNYVVIDMAAVKKEVMGCKKAKITKKTRRPAFMCLIKPKVNVDY